MAEPPILLIHGIWQAAPLVDIFSRLPLISNRLTILFRQDETDLETVINTLGDQADRIIAVFQMVTDPAITAKSHPARLPAHATITRFPLLVMECFWPLRGHDPRLVPEPPLYPNGRYPMTDTIAAELAQSPNLHTQSDAARYADYSRRSIAAMPDLEAALLRDLHMMAARDIPCDIRITSYAMDRLRHEKLFHQPYAPTGVLITHIAQGLGASLAPTLDIDPATMTIALDRFCAGLLGIAHEQTPIHPELGRRLGLTWCNETTQYRQYKNQWTFRDYILRYIAWSDWAR